MAEIQPIRCNSGALAPPLPYFFPGSPPGPAMLRASGGSQGERAENTTDVHPGVAEPLTTSSCCFLGEISYYCVVKPLSHPAAKSTSSQLQKRIPNIT